MYLHSFELSSKLGNDIKAASILMIEVPPKIWRPRQENKCRLTDYSGDIDDDILYYKIYIK